MDKRIFSRTDLALESADSGDGKLPEGVFTDERTIDGIKLTTVRIDTAGAADRLKRPIGNYVTLEGDFAIAAEPLTDALAACISAMLPEGAALVVGLGNRDITPDTIGPNAASGIIATRHLLSEQLESIGLSGMRSVCSLAPGVMGQTGLEVCSLIKAITESEGFAFVIAIDALAARSVARLGCTVQFSNTGISPGSGVLNSRAELSKESLGIPVFSLGIPTVVDAATLISDFCQDCKSDLSAAAMMVTPRNIDALSASGAKIIARAVNRALQPQLSAEDIDALMS